MLFGADDPVALEITTLIVLIASAKVAAVTALPSRLIGTVAVNWLPNGCEAVLWNHVVNGKSTLNVAVRFAKFSPTTGMIVRFMPVNARPVA